jgi:sigma-B regulation protein RsbU (phosphoserine phosphatase)
MPESKHKAALLNSWPDGVGPFPVAGIGRGSFTDEARQPVALIEQTRILSLLYDISRELTSILDLETLLGAVGNHVKRLVDYDTFSVMLLNDETGRLEHTFSLCFDQRIHVQRTLALGEGLCGTAALERRPVRVNQVALDPRYVLCDIGLPIESELVVPLIGKDRLLGVLDLESLRPEAFTEDHERLLVTLASTVAIAVENACLYDQLRRQEQRMAEDLDRAREVQRLLLPKETPRLPGVEIAVLYLPAQELGGDFYDFLPYGGGRLAIAVGDVAGKGSAAALLASLGVGILREHAVHSPSPPAEMLADLNGHLQVPGSNGRFIAMALAVYDPDRRELSLASAGFPQPLLVRDKRAVPIGVGGVPLGLLPESVYESACLRLQPGDVVVFCSDGILEQTNVQEEEFGVERLLSRLAPLCESATPERIAEDIVQAINDHAGGSAACRECHDDRTIVVLSVRS